MTPFCQYQLALHLVIFYEKVSKIRVSLTSFVNPSFSKISVCSQ